MTPRNPDPRRRARPALALLAAALALPFAAQAQNLIWENQGMTDTFGINSGSTYNYNGATVTLTWSTNTDGGTFAYAYGSNYVSYQAGMEGGHMGHVLLGFDNSNNDPDDWIELTLTFSATQTNLAFSVLDIDTGSWDDGVEILYNGTNVRNNSSVWSYAQTDSDLRTVSTDNEFGFTGWEGVNGAAATNQNYGNLNLNFNGIGVNTIRIRFFSTDDANSDPGSQKIGISDLYVVPEPPALVAAALIPLLLLLARRRLRR
jgi:hypothetical protein